MNIKELLEELKGWDPELQVQVTVDVPDGSSWTIEDGDTFEIGEINLSYGVVNLFISKDIEGD